MIKIYFNNEQDKEITQDNKSLIKKCCNNTLKLEGLTGNFEVSITFVNSEAIKEINKNYRNKDMITDVLSFPLSDNNCFDKNIDTNCFELGDIVLNIDRVIEQSQEFGHSYERELGFLTVHSMLHLLGYDHEKSKEDENIMFKKQEDVLISINLRR